jgi:hypothetical protein
MKFWRLRRVWLVAVAIGLVACAAQTAQDTASSSTSTTEATTTVATANSEWPPNGPVEPGTYHIPSSAWNVAGFTMTLPEGWEIDPAIPPGVAKNYDSEEEVSFYPVIVDAIYADPCVGTAGEEGGQLMEVGPSVDDLAQALLDQPHTVATGPVDTTLGGLPAKRIDLTVEDDPETATCNIDVPGHLQIWHSVPVDKFFVLLGDGKASVYIVDVNGERQVFLTQHFNGTPAADVSQMQTIIESITIDQ